MVRLSQSKNPLAIVAGFLLCIIHFSSFNINYAEYIDLSKGTLRSYIAVTARNFALKRLKKKKEYTSLDEIELPNDKNFDDTNLEMDEIWKAVMKLGEPDNEIFVRFYKFDEKLKDISKATGLNISTIKSKLLRGKRKLERILLNVEGLL